MAVVAFDMHDDKVPSLPVSLWHWHAVWHFLTAVSAGLLYLYYRSEEEGQRDPSLSGEYNI